MAPLPESPRAPTFRPSLDSLVRLLIDAGRWRQIEPLIRRHGADSPQMRAYVAGVVGVRRCPTCGGPFVAATRRVVHCSDRCRRSAANHGGHCQDCGVPVRHPASVRCWRCYTALRRARMVVPRCPDCGRPISRRATRCDQCAVNHRLAVRYGG